MSEQPFNSPARFEERYPPPRECHRYDATVRLAATVPVDVWATGPHRAEELAGIIARGRWAMLIKEAGGVDVENVTVEEVT